MVLCLFLRPIAFQLVLGLLNGFDNFRVVVKEAFGHCLPKALWIVLWSFQIHISANSIQAIAILVPVGQCMFDIQSTVDSPTEVIYYMINIFYILYIYLSIYLSTYLNLYIHIYMYISSSVFNIPLRTPSLFTICEVHWRSGSGR